MKVKAAIATEPGKPLIIENVDLEGPKKGEVLVEIKASGVCHTDAFTLSGDDPEGIFHGKTPDSGDALAIGSDNNLTPDVFELSQNYPNPFNPTTTFDLSMSKAQVVDFAIYNLMGQRVKTLVARSIPLGVHRISWDGKSMDGREVASGLYIAKAIGDDFNFTKKITLLR